MSRETFVVLTISTWAGMSLGAEHYYGKLSGYNKGEYVTIDLEYPLTEKQAKQLSKKDDWEYKMGRMCSRFDVKDDVRKVALEEWKERYPDAKILFEGNSASAEPLKCLWAKSKKFIDAFNKLWEENEAIPHVSKNWKKIDKLCDAFNLLIEKASK
jgi:hypothetical protein